MAETENNNRRKFFPGFRILEGILIAVGASILISLAGYLFLIPQVNLKLDMKIDSLCASMSEVKSVVNVMSGEIWLLKLKDKEHDGDINMIRERLSLEIKDRKKINNK